MGARFPREAASPQVLPPPRCHPIGQKKRGQGHVVLEETPAPAPQETPAPAPPNLRGQLVQSGARAVPNRTSHDPGGLPIGWYLDLGGTWIWRR